MHLLAVVLLSAAGGLPLVAVGQEVAPSEVAGFLQARVPSRGWLQVIHIAEAPYSAIRVAAFDFGSGAWYLGEEKQITGNDATGRAFMGKPTVGGLAFDASSPKVLYDNFVDSSIPTVIVWDLARRPEIIESARRRAEGGYYVTALLNESMRHSWEWPPPHKHSKVRVTWEIDDRARVLTRTFEGKEFGSRVFQYLADGPPEVGVCSNKGQAAGDSLLSYEWSPDSDDARFEMKAVEARMVSLDFASYKDPRRRGMTIEQFRRWRDLRAPFLASARAAETSASSWSTWFMWICGAVGLGVVAGGIWWFSRHKRSGCFAGRL